MEKRYAVVTEEKKLGYVDKLSDAIGMVEHEPHAVVIDRKARPGKTRRYTFEYGAVTQATRRPQRH